MGKTAKGKEKAERKVAKAKRKIARKAKRCEAVASAVLAFALAFLCGCATSDSAQPAKSQTQNNSFDDCIVIVASKVSLDKDGAAKVDGGELPTLELFTQTQSLESTGSTDTFSQTATQTPTADVKPNLDLRYNDAIKNATDASKGVLETLVSTSANKVLSLMQSKESGKVEVQKTDGTTATVQCENGQCSFVE